MEQIKIDELKKTFQATIAAECITLIEAAGNPNPTIFAKHLTDMFITTFASLIAGMPPEKRDDFFQKGILAIAKDVKQVLSKVNINLNVLFLN
jgi:hypothetical protein